MSLVLLKNISKEKEGELTQRLPVGALINDRERKFEMNEWK